jgi:hypothetical protein
MGLFEQRFSDQQVAAARAKIAAGEASLRAAAAWLGCAPSTLSVRIRHARDRGLSTMQLPYAKRRALLEELDVEGPHAKLVATFEDGEALFRVVCDRGLEGVVAKRERDPYRPGERGWVKTKNRRTARFAEELDGVRRQVDRRRGVVLS